MRRTAWQVAVLWLAAVGSGCGSDAPGVPVGQAAEDSYNVPRPSPWRSNALDTVYADTLAPDPSRADSRAADTAAVAEARQVPDVGPVWQAVQEAARRRQRAAWDAATGQAPGASLAWEALDGGPFLDGLLALTPRDLRRDGSARMARIVVGYDADGRVVPQEEAERDRTLTLRLDVVDGAYRVVDVEAP